MERQSYPRKGQARVGNRGVKQEQEASLVTPGIGEGGIGKGGGEGRQLAHFSLSPLTVPVRVSTPV